jgi:hypothetical protein
LTGGSFLRWAGVYVNRKKACFGDAGFLDRRGFGEKIHLKEKLNFNQISMFIYSNAP